MLLWTLGCMHLFKLVFASLVLLLFLGSFPPLFCITFLISLLLFPTMAGQLQWPLHCFPWCLPILQQSGVLCPAIPRKQSYDREGVSGWKSVKKKGPFCMWRGGWRCASRDHLRSEKWAWSSQSNASNFTAMGSLYSQWHSQAVILSSSQGRTNCFFILDVFAFMYSCVGALSP